MYVMGVCIYVRFTVFISVYVCMYSLCCMYCVCIGMYVCMEEVGSWTNIPSCLSFLRYVLSKHHGPWYKLLARDLRPVPSLVFTEYLSQILSAWCQFALWPDGTVPI